MFKTLFILFHLPIYILLVLALPLSASAQSQTEKIYKKAKRISASEYDTAQAQYVYSASYGKSLLKDLSIEKGLSSTKWTIKRIDLVYSKFPVGKEFPELNKKRIQNLIAINPSLSLAQDIEWRLVGLKGCDDKACAKNLFHGFAVYAEKQKAAIPEKRHNDKEENPTTDSLTSTPKSSDSPPMSTNERWQIDLLKHKELGNIPYDKITQDSTVFEAFDRNSHKWGKDWVVVTDLTYSMEPYAWELFIWQANRKDNHRPKAYLFFNDGNKLADKEKTIGNTGGIYRSESQNLDSLQRFIARVMKAGNGGDIPENDIEALLFAQEKYPDTKELILIADNKSGIRDLELLKHLHKPVRIVLARTLKSKSSVIRPYIQVALATGGSIHGEFFDIENKEELQFMEDAYAQTEKDYKQAEKEMKKSLKRLRKKK